MVAAVLDEDLVGINPRREHARNENSGDIGRHSFWVVLGDAGDRVSPTSEFVKEAMIWSPAGHREALRVTAGDHSAAGHALATGDAVVVLSIEEDVLVDLVRVDAQVGPAPRPDQSRNRLQILLGDDTSGGVRRGAEDDQLGSVREPIAKVFG